MCSKTDALVENFCISPSAEKFHLLPYDVQKIFFRVGKYCIKKYRGNLDLARKVYRYYRTRNMSERNKNSLRAVFRCLKLLQTDQFRKISRKFGDEYYPRVKVYTKNTGNSSEQDDLTWQIDYSQELPDMFHIRQVGKQLGIAKDFSLYNFPCRNYFIDSLASLAFTGISVTEIRVDLSEDLCKTFYTVQDGIVWDEAECYIQQNTTSRGEIRIFPGFWSVKDVRKNRDYIFVYGDNDEKSGKGGQAVVREEGNTLGIPTKKRPNNSTDSFYTDNELEENKKKISSALKKLDSLLAEGKHVYLPEDGIGTGLAKLSTKAPRTFAYLQTRLTPYYTRAKLNSIKNGTCTKNTESITWDCPVCDLRNEVDASVCIACQADRA